jgi:hypothetical protein
VHSFSCSCEQQSVTKNFMNGMGKH